MFVANGSYTNECMGTVTIRTCLQKIKDISNANINCFRELGHIFTEDTSSLEKAGSFDELVLYLKGKHWTQL